MHVTIRMEREREEQRSRKEGKARTTHRIYECLRVFSRNSARNVWRMYNLYNSHARRVV